MCQLVIGHAEAHSISTFVEAIWERQQPRSAQEADNQIYENAYSLIV
jgi:hypothetical protein